MRNFQQYTVAIAAIDGVGNTGPLSVVSCNTPEPIDDFFKVYRDAGGQAGGGYCQAGPVGVGGGASLLAAASSLAAWLLRRRGGRR